jgi:hypothetical protein
MKSTPDNQWSAQNKTTTWMEVTTLSGHGLAIPRNKEPSLDLMGLTQLFEIDAIAYASHGLKP